MQRTVVRVDISCSKCKKKILKAVSLVPGVDKVEIDEVKGTVAVTGNADPYEIITRIRKRGKDVEVLSIGPPPSKQHDGDGGGQQLRKPDDKEAGGGDNNKKPSVDKSMGGDEMKMDQLTLRMGETAQGWPALVQDQYNHNQIVVVPSYDNPYHYDNNSSCCIM
ncbi:Heavy metal-associated isoprenylated plant protein 34 [Linum grandiflorum]